MNKKKNPKKKNSLLITTITLVCLVLATIFLISFGGKKPSACKHKYTEYTETVKPTSFTVGERQQTCKKCGDVVTERVNALVDLPQLYLSGDTTGISKTNDCMMKSEYFEGESRLVDAFATIKYQGHSSMAYDKKNYTIKFYEEESFDKKYKFSLNGWEPTSKYCLKANYIDYSSARNVVSSNIWSDVVKSRKKLDENIGELEFYGGIDGFPVALFINDEYVGLYTFNIPKDEDTYKIADEEKEAMFIINTSSFDCSNFKALITEKDIEDIFELEYSYNDEKQWPQESMNTLLSFVINNDGEDFKKDVEKYLDIDAAIDYLATAYVLGVTDNFSKNMILLTYDGQKWIPNMYDLDTACGLAFDGSAYSEYDFSVPEKNADGKILSGTENLLWDRILNNYTEEFKSRYFELREGVLDTDNVINRYADFIESIPAECYEQEIKLYAEIPHSDVNQNKQMSTFLKARCDLLDSLIESF